MNNFLSSGQLAQKTGINKETLRYYEREGLLPEPKRGSNGYRQYMEESVQKISFIKTAQALGFSLSEIKELLALSIRYGESCSLIHDKANEKLDLINNKILELEKMKAALIEFSNRCIQEDKVEDCHFIHTLWGIEGDCHE